MKTQKTKTMPNGEVRSFEVFTCDCCGKNLGDNMLWIPGRITGKYLPNSVVEIAGKHYGKTCAQAQAKKGDRS